MVVGSLLPVLLVAVVQMVGGLPVLLDTVPVVAPVVLVAGWSPPGYCGCG